MKPENHRISFSAVGFLSVNILTCTANRQSSSSTVQFYLSKECFTSKGPHATEKFSLGLIRFLSHKELYPLNPSSILERRPGEKKEKTYFRERRGIWAQKFQIIPTHVLRYLMLLIWLKQ